MTQAVVMVIHNPTLQAFCNNKLFFIISTQLHFFLVSFKAVRETPVPEHEQRKEHVFQALTLE